MADNITNNSELNAFKKRLADNLIRCENPWEAYAICLDSNIDLRDVIRILIELGYYED